MCSFLTIWHMLRIEDKKCRVVSISLIIIFIMSTTIYWLYYLSLIDYWAPVTVSAALKMWQFNSHKIHFPPDSWRKWDSEGSRDVLWVTVNSEIEIWTPMFFISKTILSTPTSSCLPFGNCRVLEDSARGWTLTETYLKLFKHFHLCSFISQNYF